MGVEDTIRRIWEEQQKLPELVAQQVPAKYQHFVCWLDQTKLLTKQKVAVTPELRACGVFATDRGTYIALRVPYMAVDGRMLWFADLHREAGAKYSVFSNINELCELLKSADKPPAHYPLVVWIESELFGRLEGVSRIFWGASGPHETNPLETAYTSALGRAIAQAGIGLIGTGIASAEEVEAAQAVQDQLPAATAPPPAPPASAASGGRARAGAPAAGDGGGNGGAGAAPEQAAPAGHDGEATPTAPGIFWVKGHLPQKSNKGGKASFRVILRQEDGREFTVLAEEPAVISALMKALREKAPVRPTFTAGPDGLPLVTGVEQVVA